jgi:hypothetical protein
MLAAMFAWKARVAAALVLASFLRMSDGNQFWAGVLPALLVCGAVLAITWHVVIARHGHAR